MEMSVIGAKNVANMIIEKYRKVASSNASRFVARLIYNHTQKPDLLIRS